MTMLKSRFWTIAIVFACQLCFTFDFFGKANRDVASFLEVLTYMDIDNDANVRTDDHYNTKLSLEDIAVLDDPNAYENSFSACLSVYNEIAELPEWIAYHYHTMKLRHLIVAIGPRIPAQSLYFLDPWRDLLAIDVWNLTDFRPDSSEKKTTSRDKFNDKCTKRMIEHNRTLLGHFGIQEYVSIQPHLRQQNNGEWRGMPLPSLGKQSSIFNFIHKAAELGKIEDYTCMPIFLLSYKARKDNISNADGMPAGFNAEKFRTIASKYHEQFDGKKSKTLLRRFLDVSHPEAKIRIQDEGFLTRGYPLGSLCHKPEISLTQSPLSQSYLSLQWSRFDPKSKVSLRKGEKWTLFRDTNWINDWVSGFVESVGKEKAMTLLSGYKFRSKPDHLRPNEDDSFSLCLLIKDDNPILPEWIAYHYHTMKLRYLIVAVDPLSVTTPVPILNKWSDLMEIEVWNQTEYMPESFLQGDYLSVPSRVAVENVQYTTGIDPVGSVLDRGGVTDPDQREKFILTNNHRYRQLNFYNACIRRLIDKNRTIMAQIDSDEYVVVNPMIKHQKSWSRIDLPNSMKPNSVFHFLKSLLREQKMQNYPCVGMPRLLYSAREDYNTKNHAMRIQREVPPGVNAMKFDTLRWKHHNDFTKSSHNMQKYFLDLSSPALIEFFNESVVTDIHRPVISSTTCFLKEKVELGYDRPLILNHYLGPWNRYNQRDDPRERRSKDVYKSRETEVTFRDNHWINGWVRGFFESVGLLKASYVLPNCMTEEAARQLGI